MKQTKIKTDEDNFHKTENCQNKGYINIKWTVICLIRQIMFNTFYKVIQLSMQLVHITADVLSSNLEQGEVYNIL